MDVAMPATIADGRAAIDAYAATVTERFEADFKRVNGFDVAVNPQRITSAQCPAVSFLSRLRAAAGGAPRLEVSAAVVRSGSAMSGSVGGFSDRSIELLLVADEKSSFRGIESRVYESALRLPTAWLTISDSNFDVRRENSSL